MAVDPGMSGGRAPASAALYAPEKKESAVAEWLPFVLGVLALLTVFAAMTMIIRSRATTSIISNGDFSEGVSGWIITGDMQPQVVSVDDASVTRALRLQVNTVSVRNRWDLQLLRKSTRDLPKGTNVRINFWARSPEGLTMSAIYQSAAGASTMASRTLGLTPKWREYSIKGVMDRDYAVGETEVAFHLAYGDIGTVEIADVSAVTERPMAP